MTKAPATAAPAIRYVQVHEMKGIEYSRNDFRVVPVKAISVEDLLQPTAWAHVANQLGKGDMIEAVAEDSSWYVRLLIRDIVGLEVHVGVVTEAHFKTDSTKARAAA